MHLNEYFKTQPYGQKAELARRLGITKQWMSEILSGRQAPTAMMAVEIERATGVSRKLLRPDVFGDVE